MRRTQRTQRMQRTQRTATGSVLLLVLAGLLGACSSDDIASGGADQADAETQEAVPAALGRPAVNAAYDAGSGAASGGGGTSTAVADAFGEVPAVGPRVIKTATVELEVARDELEQATRDSIAIAGRFGGFVLSTDSHSDRSATSTVVLRIPADSFERALADLEGLGDVKGEQISGQDVGQEFVDMEARVRNLEAQETVLLRLMDRAASVSDTIRVQRELQGVQMEIERLTGRLRYLEDQTDLGTISLSLVEVGAPGHKPPSGVLAKAWSRAVDVALAVVAAVIVGVGFLVPISVLAAAGYLVMRALRPRLSS